MGEEEKKTDEVTGNASIQKKDETKNVVEKEKTTDKPVKDVDSLRKVIKVDQKEETKEQENKKTDGNEQKKEVKSLTPSKKETKSPIEVEDDISKEGLEQKRAILQSIKDFDFQIKKNQEDISGISQKIDGFSKDLDDLVSLYEIVSEQMNPFVGLSKVTKKRLDALENFTKEIEYLKDRIGELESFAERSGAKLQSLDGPKKEVKTIDTDTILGEGKKIPEIEKTEEQPDVEPSSTFDETKSEENQLEQDGKFVDDTDMTVDIEGFDIDTLIDAILSPPSFGDSYIDVLINEFIESLKG